MSEYRLFRVIRTDGQKYFDIEYVRDVVTCGECKYWGDTICERFEEKRIMFADDFCSYGERNDNGSDN